MKNASIILFGDSYTAGRVPHTQRDGAFREALGLPLYADCALSGSTAQQWAADIEGRLSGVERSTADIAVGSLGGNDAFAAAADGVVSDTEKVVALASCFYVLMRIARNMRVILMLYPDPFCGARPDAAEGHRQLKAAISAVAGRVNALYGTVTQLDLSTVLGPQHFDGSDIHPNEAGYAAMAAAVKAAIEVL